MKEFEKKRTVYLSLLLLLSCTFEGKGASNTSKLMCRGCTSCNNGINGQNGLPGRDGRDGAKGQRGVSGPAGSRGAKGDNGVAGTPGPRGEKGEKGVVGNPGSRGVKGEVGPKGSDTEHRNWKQCAWKKVDGRDTGLIQDCVFNKKKNNSALRVAFQSNFRLYCNTCCKRWFITFNGAECSGPLPVEAVMWIRSSNQDNHLPGAIEGFCDNIPKGKIRVGINIGNCAGGRNADSQTGWGVVSRLVIEEVPRSQ
ncbi:collagen triple helix repeat-containing protein 1-like isoform X1 [Oculina patagonica]